MEKSNGRRTRCKVYSVLNSAKKREYKSHTIWARSHVANLTFRTRKLLVPENKENNFTISEIVRPDIPNFAFVEISVRLYDSLSFPALALKVEIFWFH